MSWRSKSYEALPALSVGGQHLREAMRRITLAWMFGVVWLSCVSGAHVKVFARMLGFNDFAFGLMAAVPFLATFGQIIASAMIERTGLVKHQFLYWATVHRILWLMVAAVPLALPIPSSLAVGAMLVILTASWLAQALSAPAWVTWMGRLVPRRIRGRYFAGRARLGMMVQAVVVIAIGLILDAVYDPARQDDATTQPVVLRVICLFFFVAAVFGVIDILLFAKVPEPLRSVSSRPPIAGLREFIWAPLKDREFRCYVLYATTLAFSITVAGWYFWLNAMENLGFSSLATNALFLVIGPLAGIVSARAWGKALDRWGRKPVLMLCTVGAVICLLPWFFLTRNALGGFAGTYTVAALTCLAGGTVWTGIDLAATGVVLGFADGNGESRYVAASAVLISIGGALGGLTGGAVTQALQALQQDPIRLGPFLWNNWHAAFAVAVLSRASAIFWLAGMPEPTAVGVRDLIRMMRINVYSNARTRIFYPLRIFGWRRAAGPQRAPRLDNGPDGK